MPTVSVIGLDGVNWIVLEEAMEKGLMPNLEEVLEGSFTAELETTYPSVTGPAWTSIMTGVNPGRHGVYDFLDHVNGGKPYSSKDIDNHTIYEKVAEHGKVCLINLPLSYPPKFEGEFVGSFLAPEDDFYRPKELGRRFDFDDYKARLSAVEKSLRVVSNGSKTAESKRLLAKELMDDQDLFFLLFSAPDWIMHNHYHNMDDGSCDKCFNVFETIDETIGDALERSDDVMILSDHGFRNYSEVFYVNQWLEEEGYLETEGSMDSQWLDNRAIEGLFDVLKSSELLKSFTRRFYLGSEDYLPLPENVKVRISSMLSEGIDRENSKAFCPSTELAGIYLNDERFDGRIKDAENLKNEIIDRLPEDVEAIDAEKIYEGKNTGEAPDIVLKEEKYYVSRGIYGDVFSDRSINHHARKGFLVANGEHIESSESREERIIYDVAPTIASLLGLEIDADGESIPVSEADSVKDVLPEDY